MFRSPQASGYVNALPGIVRKTLVHGERMLLAEFRLEKGSALPSHAHPYEQTGYLVSGRMRLTVGNEQFEVEPGASWSIPGDAPHSAEILEDSVAIEVFSPARGDYLPK